MTTPPVSREWRELWSTTADEDTQAANLTELVANGSPVPGALILSVNDGGDEGWISLDYASVKQLRDALDAWLATQ